MNYFVLKGNLNTYPKVNEGKSAKSIRNRQFDEFFAWVENSPFYGKNALAKAAEYTLNQADGLTAFLNDGRIEIDNKPVENTFRPNVISRKNWLFSVSEAGAKANAICLRIAETAKSEWCRFLSVSSEVIERLTKVRYS